MVAKALQLSICKCSYSINVDNYPELPTIAIYKRDPFSFEIFCNKKKFCGIQFLI